MIELEELMQSGIKGLMSTSRSIYADGKAMTSAFDYFMCGKTLIINSDDSSVVGWFADKTMAESLVNTHNEKLISEYNERRGLS